MAYGPDPEQVYDDIIGAFRDKWLADTPALNGGTAPEVEWPDEPQTETPLAKGTEPWARITLKHTTRNVRSIGTLPGQGRVEASGVLRVNIFLPAGKRGLTTAARLGKVAIAAFEGQRAGDVRFTDVVPEEVGVDGAWFQYDVKAKFHYDYHL